MRKPLADEIWGVVACRPQEEASGAGLKDGLRLQTLGLHAETISGNPGLVFSQVSSATHAGIVGNILGGEGKGCSAIASDISLFVA